MIRELLAKFWNDESGVVTTEYLLLGTVVAVGGVGGMTAMRDSVNDEYKELGNSVREVRQSYSAPARKGGSGTSGGTTVTNAPIAQTAPGTADPLATGLPVVPSTQSAQITFSSP